MGNVPRLKWSEERHACSRADLGARLVLSVDYEGVKRLSNDEPKWNVHVFGRQMKKRMPGLVEAQAYAEFVARKWLKQALNDLKGEKKDAVQRVQQSLLQQRRGSAPGA